MTIDHTYQEFAEGIKKPIKEIKTPIRFMDDTQLHVGEKHITNFENEEAMVIAFRNYRDIDIQFQDQYGYIKRTSYLALDKGNCKNPYHPNQYGGFFGVGPYDGITDKYFKKAKNVWNSMLRRVNENFENRTTRNISYEKCTLHSDWYNYQNFARWYLSYYYPLNKEVDYEIDKDILQWNMKENLRTIYLLFITSYDKSSISWIK